MPIFLVWLILHTMQRPPIVVVMGHVDHGKTTLLDFIRKSNTAPKEAGGITQSVGAYEITHHDKKMTFIDTPGHEAFAVMRARGARAADIAILVIAADDGIQPQTLNALSYILETKIPYIVAINKIDKSGIDLEKVKNDCAKAGIYLEGRGGTISWHGISAKTGEGVDAILDLIELTADVENFSYDPDVITSGIILSSAIDQKRGIIATGILKNGTARQGDFIITPSATGRIKILENHEGKPASALLPSAPVILLGFETAPRVGESFVAGNNLQAIRATLPQEEVVPPLARTRFTREELSKRTMIILKADEAGSLEVLSTLVRAMDAIYPLVIVAESIGNIHESEVKLAESTGAIIVGFRTKEDSAARNLAHAKKVMIFTSAVIYTLQKELEVYFKKTVSHEARTLEILAVFGQGKNQNERIVGGKVLCGPIHNQETFEIWDDKKLIGKGSILNLQVGRADSALVEKDQEAGMLVKSEEPIKVGYRLVFELNNS